VLVCGSSNAYKQGAPSNSHFDLERHRSCSSHTNSSIANTQTHMHSHVRMYMHAHPHTYASRQTHIHTCTHACTCMLTSTADDIENGILRCNRAAASNLFVLVGLSGLASGQFKKSDVRSKKVCLCAWMPPLQCLAEHLVHTAGAHARTWTQARWHVH